MQLINLPNSSARALRPLVFTDEADRAEFYSYFAGNAQAEADIRELHDAMLRIDAAPNRHAGAKAVAQPGREGWSAQYLRRLCDEWEAAGRDWRWLLDTRKFPEARKPKYHVDTEAWLRGKLYAHNKRVTSESIRAIHAQWRSWWRTRDERFAIPGLVDADGHPQCPAPDGNGLPRLLEEHNLRRIALDPAVVRIIREGTHAARAILPHIPGTREGVRPLEHVSADDMEGDAAVLCVGYGAVKPLQFGFWDYACSYYFPEAVGIRPRLPSDDEKASNRPKWEKLKRRDFLFNVAIFLETYGWPADYAMHLLLENGTATASRAEAMFLETLSEGLIKVGYSSMDGEFVMAYEEKKCGRSTAKAGHEGYHRILKDSLAHLRGFTGKDREHVPALLQGQVRAAEALENALLHLPADERFALLENPNGVRPSILTLEQYIAETRNAIGRIHDRADHDCELFADVMCWRPRGFHIEPAMPELLPAFLAQHRIAPDDVARINEFVEFLPRKETRAERWRRLTSGVQFIKPPAGALVPLYEDNFVVRPIEKDYAFEFKHEGRKMRFFPPTPDHRLPVGEKVCGFWRPDGEVIHLFSSPDGKNRRHLVTWPAEGKLMRSASAEVKAEFFNRQQTFFRAAKLEADTASAEQIAEARAEFQQNHALLTEAGVLRDEAPAPTATTRAVQAVTQARTDGERAVQRGRKVDVVRETLKRGKARRAATETTAPSKADSYA